MELVSKSVADTPHILLARYSKQLALDLRLGPALVMHHETRTRPGGKAMRRSLIRRLRKTRDGISVTRAYRGSEADGVGYSLDFSYYEWWCLAV
jgi:hypothetical protein